MRELELIASLQDALGGPGGSVLRGPGDDAAVVRSRGYAVTSVDAMIDGVHFRLDQLTPAEIGHRSLAAALSDLAAMGAEPGEAYLVLGLPADSDAALALGVVGGAQALAEAVGVKIAGGDVIRAPALIVSFTVVGWSADPGELVGRDGARPGDLVAVTGTIGDAGAGLALLDGAARMEDGAAVLALRERYAKPWPQLGAGRILAAAGARAMIDLSDGLATDATHLARASAVRIELSLDSLPLTVGVREVAARLGSDPAELAVGAGDDYELCACVPPAAAPVVEAKLSADGVEVSWIGRVTAGEPEVLWDGGSRSLTGYEHSL